MMTVLSRVADAALVMACISPLTSWAEEQSSPQFFDYQVLRTYPHDQTAFCQGLAFSGGHLFEGTGRYGQSSLRKVDLNTGRILHSHVLDKEFFGEGITVWKQKIFQLTWKNQTCFILDEKSFQPIAQSKIIGEGWGLTHDEHSLILSDGTSEIQFLSPETFEVTKRLKVADRGKPISQLNELEYIDGWIYANVWHSDFIAIISPETGRVGGWIDLRGLFPLAKRPHAEAVLNGIAYDKENRRLIVTGKDWPRLFELRLIPRPVPH